MELLEKLLDKDDVVLGKIAGSETITASTQGYFTEGETLEEVLLEMQELIEDND